MLDAQPPDRFTVKFIENLGFASTNDRLFIGILKDIGFLNRDGGPQPRYFEFLDCSRSKQVVAAGVKDAYADLFAINVRGQRTQRRRSQEQITNSVRREKDRSGHQQYRQDI